MDFAITKPKVFLTLVLNALLCILCVLFEDIKFGVAASLIQLIISVFMIYFAYRRTITFGIVFLVLSYILHMGNLLTTQLFGSNNIYLYTLKNSTIFKGIFFFMICHLMLTLGLCFGANRGYNSDLHRKTIIRRVDFWRVGIICTLVGIVPRIYLDYTQIQQQMQEGYGNLSVGFGWISILGQFFYVGILTLLFISDDNKRRARFILISVSLWEVLTMISGGRIYAISMIISMLYIYLTRIEKPKAKHVILGAVLCCIICSIMYSIALIRRNGAFSLNTLKTSVRASFVDDNPIIGILEEMGSTFMSLALAIDNFPSYRSYAFGKSYIDTILSVIPAYENNVADIKDLIFIRAFRSNSYLGGSWLAEAYYNFSWFGCLYCLAWGILLGKIEKILNIDKDGNDNFNLSSLFVITFLFYIVTYLRDYFYRFTTTIQLFIVVWAMVHLFKFIFKKSAFKT